MTKDEESRKAYFSVQDLGSPIPPTPWEIWQAAVEFATKRERERCLSIFLWFREHGGYSHEFIDKVNQEPKE